ncbi:DUF2179 domain-containing protein [Mycoplasmopsis primatum]|uniref:DUF2179 domain-containing protein n=1 Tax=Mycoplasmopsis primatum TaxID=55604 RepID=UPI0004973CA1|nr:DUF2179 domain-containing protein [Mycoplasmopsis primatum]
MTDKNNNNLINEELSEENKKNNDEIKVEDVLQDKHKDEPIETFQYDELGDILTDKDRNKIRIVDKKNTQYRYTKMSNFVLQLSRFYALMPLWKLGLITAILSILYGVAGIFLVKNPGIYNFGLAAFGQAVSKITVTALRHNPNITKLAFNIIEHSLFWVLYLVLSIPLFIFSWKKLGKVYTLLTLEFLVLSSLVSVALGQIPALNDFTIFGNFDHPEISENVKRALENHDHWNAENTNNLIKLLPLQWNDGGNTIVQIIFAIIYGIMLAYFFAIIAILGGSAGVTGIIGEYMSVYKQKNFGTINGYINIVIILFSVLIGTYIPGSMIAGDFAKVSQYLDGTDNDIAAKIGKLAWQADFYFSPNFASTYVCNFIFVIYLNNLFPRFKIVQFKVYSHNMDAIRKAIVSDSRTINSFTVQNGVGGYSGNKLEILSSITLYRQIPRLIKKVRSIDTEALITISNVASVDGRLYIPEQKF